MPLIITSSYGGREGNEGVGGHKVEKFAAGSFKQKSL